MQISHSQSGHKIQCDQIDGQVDRKCIKILGAKDSRRGSRAVHKVIRKPFESSKFTDVEFVE